MGLRGSLLATLLLSTSLTGCFAGEASQQLQEPASVQDNLRRPTVVALIDSGIDVYHEAFRVQPTGPDAEDSPAVGAAVVFPSSEGAYESRRRADASIWESVEPGKLYSFAGTRVLGISMLDAGDPMILNPDGPWILDPHGHGTGVSSMVALYDPDAIIVMVQVHAGDCVVEGRSDCQLHPSVARGMAWAAEQSWIDVISVSIALLANGADSPDLHPEMRTYLEASRSAHQRGKILLNGAGNSVTPPLPDYFNGPPWIIAVGGVEPNPRGSPWQTSHQVDVVANFSEWMATAGTLDGWDWGSGTSIASPIVAATLSKALRQVRENLTAPDLAPGAAPSGGALASGLLDGAAVAFTSKDFRDALNFSGVHVGATEWDPTRRSTNKTYPGAEIDEMTIPIVAPFVQMGWGYVHPTVAGAIAARVLARDHAVPADKAETALHQGMWQEVRETYWRQFA